MLSDAKRLAARMLRGVASLLDPVPPDQTEALKMLGWQWDGTHWIYCGFPPTTANVTWHMKMKGEG